MPEARRRRTSDGPEFVKAGKVVGRGSRDDHPAGGNLQGAERLTSAERRRESRNAEGRRLRMRVWINRGGTHYLMHFTV